MNKTAAGVLAAGALVAGAIGVSLSETDVPPTPSPTPTVAPTPKPVPPKPTPPKSRAEPSCNPNYSGCLTPGASDYDCAGGSGDGPYYTGPIQVLGYDQYGLDRDGDGWACE